MTAPIRLRVAREVMSAAFAADPARTMGSAALIVLAAAPGLLAAFALQQFAQSLSEPDPGRTVVAAALAAAGVAARLFAGSTAVAVRSQAREKTTHELALRMARAAATVPTLEHLERPDYADRVELARSQRAVMASALDVLLLTAAAALQIIVTVVVLGSIHPLMAALAVFAIPTMWASARATARLQKLSEHQAERRRVAHHLFDVSTTVAGGIEARVFGHQTTLVARRRAILDELEHERVRVDHRNRATAVGAATVLAAAVMAAVAYIADGVLDGRRSPGDLVLVLALGTQLRAQVGGLRDAGGGLLATLASGERYVWLVDHARHAATASRCGDPHPAPEAFSAGIRLEHVTFRYSGATTDALTDIDVTIPAGSVVAVVGDNGAGKTTLVKLLMRAYDPTEGRITVDGVDLRSIDPAEWRQRLTAAFQDFARFELKAGEAVGSGDLPRVTDTRAIQTAVERAGASATVSVLPGGMGTQLGRSFEHGLELSGGQWQQLALSRAMMRDDPLLLILDEPTSNLDSLAEQRIFERYSGAARRAAGNGAVTVMVSHRFSTVAAVDLIIVLDHGRLVEVGSHDELLRRGGMYSELHELQARAYRRNQGGPMRPSTAAASAVSHARSEAASRRQAAIGQEHLLIALTKAPDSLALRTLDAVGVSLGEIAAGFRAALVHGSADNPTPTPRLLAAIERAEAEAARSSRGVTTADLVVGILATGEGIGHAALSRAGATVDAVRRARDNIDPTSELSTTSTTSLADALSRGQELP